MKNKFLYILLFLLIYAGNAHSNNVSDVFVEIKEGNISVSCKDAKLEDVVKKIAEGMSITYKVYPDMKTKVVSANFKQLAFKEAIKIIVGENYALVYADEKSEKISKLYVLYKGKGNNEKYELIEKYHKQVFPEVPLLKSVVDRNVLIKHPTAQFYEMIPHYNLYGKLISYVFTYYTGSGNAPEKGMLNDEIKTAWEEKKLALDQIHRGYEERDSAKMSKAMTISMDASRRISRQKDFVSLEVGANYETSPVMAFWNGLSLDVSQYPRALDVVEKELSDKNPKFIKTYTTGLLSIAFAFEGKDKKNYYVDPKNQNIFTSWEKKAQKKDVKDKIKDSNKKKWACFLGI